MSNTNDFWKEYENILKHGTPNLNPNVVDGGFIIDGSVLQKYIGDDEKVTVPDGITKIGPGAFRECEKVKSIHLPDSVETIDHNAFYYCTKLKTINLPEKIERLENECFWECKKLNDIVLPANLKYIGFQAFYHCIGLKNIVIPEKVELIDKEAFRKCNKLQTMTILGMPKLDKDCLRQTNTALITCHLPITKISGLNLKHQAVLGWIQSVDMQIEISVKVSASIKQYINNIFDALVQDIDNNHDLLPKLIKRNVLDINQTDTLLDRFAGDAEKVSILLAYKNENFSSVDIAKNEEKMEEKALRAPTAADIKKLWATKVESDGTITLVTYKGAEKNILVPNMVGKKTVTKIGSECFANTFTYGESMRSVPNINERLQIESVTIPDGVTTIENAAFKGCKALQSVVVPNSVTTIGHCAFQDCENLQSINIPEGVTVVGNNPFEGCHRLKDQDGNIIIGNTIYGYSGQLTNVIIPEGIKTIGNNAFKECKSLQTVIIPDSVTTIGNYAFYACRNLKSVHIPNGVTTIGNCAFQNCESLTSINIPESVTTFGRSPFKGCYGLKDWDDGLIIIQKTVYGYLGQSINVIIPDGITTIAPGAFDECLSLQSITIPNSVTAIGSYAFYACRSLKSVNIPNSITCIGCSAFYLCQDLQSVTIPSSVKFIGSAAFEWCHVKIHAPIGSYAETYAKDNNIPFVAE